MTSLASDLSLQDDLSMAALNLDDEKIVDFCNANDSTMSYCEENPDIVARLDNIDFFKENGVSSSTSSSIRSLLSTGTRSQKAKKIASLEDGAFLEAAAVEEDVADIIRSNQFLSIRLDSLDHSLAGDIGVSVPDYSSPVLSSSPRSRRLSASPSARTPARSSVRRTPSGNLMLSGNLASDAAMLSQVPQSELDEYEGDDNIADALEYGRSTGVVPSPSRTASASSRRSPPVSPVRSPSTRATASPASSYRASARSFPATTAPRSPRSVSGSPGRRSFPVSLTSPPAASAGTARSISPSARMNSVESMKVTYNKSEDARTLSAYPRSEVDRAARSNPYIESLVRSPEYSRFSSALVRRNSSDDESTLTCSVNCQRRR